MANDVFHIPSSDGIAEQFIYQNLNTPVPLNIPRGKSMCHIFALGCGGAGGAGAIGALATAAGGGGGGSGAQVRVLIPVMFLPKVINIFAPSGNSSGNTFVFCEQNNIKNVIVQANRGLAGGNAAGATAGAAGVAGTVSTMSLMAYGWPFLLTALAGAAGIIGGTTVAGAALTTATTGILVSGGVGGGGLPATAIAGAAGGGITASALSYANIAGGVGGAATTTPPGNGISHIPQLNQFTPTLGFAGLWFGGTGGGSTHGGATGAGLVQSNGGDGGIGCGGGGSGGALTGSVAGVVGKGGPGLVVVTFW